MNVLKTLIKGINKNDIAFDEKGRIVIRLINEEKQNLSFVEKDTKLSNILLHPEDRIVKKSLHLWASQILQALNVHANSLKDNAAKIASIYNHAALIFFSLEDIHRARELCYTQIKMFMELNRNSKEKIYLKYAYQPWINLSRIDRAEGRTQEALHKLSSLWSDNCINAVSLDAEVMEVVKNCRLLEPIKVFLLDQRYDDLLMYISKSFDKENSVVLEAEIVALANIGKYQQALEKIQFAKRSVSPLLLPIFIAREGELIKNKETIKRLIQYAHKLLSHESINNILFSIHISTLSEKNHLLDDSINLLYLCLELVKKIGDEVLEAECLTRLYRLTQNKHDKSCIERYMQKLLINTDYKYVQKILLNACENFKAISIQNDFALYEDLYEQLINFSIHYSI